MKTLYESILDADTKIMNHADKKATAYLKRKKKIDLVLDAFEDLVLDWGFKFSHDVDFGKYSQIGSKNAIARYFSKLNKTKVEVSKQELVDCYNFLKNKFASIWDECAPEENLTLSNNPSAGFTFKGLGLKVWISLNDRINTLSNYSEIFLMIYFDKNDKYIGDVADLIVQRIS